MALFRRRLQLRGHIINLTQRNINTYSEGGAIKNFPPSPPVALRPDFFYIVEQDSPRKGTNLVVTTREGIGRDGVFVSVLCLKNDPDVRVFPQEGGE